jgi:hypothetical protein
MLLVLLLLLLRML